MSFLQKCLSLALLLLIISAPTLAKTQATASVNDNQVFLGDVFILTVEVNDTGSEYQLDTTSLVNNFTVYRPSRSQQTSYINGDLTEQTTWTLRLQAKKTGAFVIPRLKLGNAQTQAIKIIVSQPGKQQKSSNGEAIFIENTVNKDTIYLEQPVILESKIFVSENINDADIEPPTLDGANIERIGTDKQTQIVRNGIRYQVFSYQYQITPSASGKVSITSPLLIGSLRKAIRINEWQNKVIAEPINIRGNDIAITIKEIPANFEGKWLVSEDVRLIENNDLQEQEYFVGDPITRSISLQIASLPIDKMPEIKFNYDNSLRYYPDQDDLKQGTVDDLLYSQRTSTHAIIANQSGQLTLPEIKIAWWNSLTEQQQFTTLPAQTLTIKPALKGSNDQQYGNLQPIQNPPPLNNLHSNHNGTNNGQDNTTQLLVWQISTLVLLLLLIMSIFYHLQQKKLNKTGKDKVQQSNANTAPYQQLLIAIQQGKTASVYVTLLRYLQSQQSTIIQLKQVEALTALNDDKKQQLLENLQQLELACSGKAHQWDAKTLLALIKLHHKVTKLNDLNAITVINP